MNINPVSSSSASVTTTEALRPQQNAKEAQRANGEVKNDSESTPRPQQAAPKAFVNTNGETIGTRINITA